MLSSFELAKGYLPSLICSRKQLFTEDLLRAHTELFVTLPLNLLLLRRCHGNITTDTIPIITDILLYHRSTKHTDPNQWRTGKVFMVRPHVVEVINESIKHYKVAVEDLRIRPQAVLTRQLQEGTVEEFMVN